ncbi:MAG: M1 family metallopeptidase [Labilithrix sp.]|nr:M1 family metallopeptidase [Labilithrix sp.]
MRAPLTLASSCSALVAALLVVGCPGEPPPAAPAPPAVAIEPPTPLPAPLASGRLPPLATPLGYALDLDVDPDKPRFSGTVRVEVDVPAKTSFLVMHGRALEVTSARALLPPPRPGVLAAVSTRTAHGGKAPDELVLAFPEPLPPGRALIVLDYTAPFDDSLAGLYRVKDGGRSYAFTQFEPTDARRAFPCFDEPSFKVPFDVTVTVPRSMIAVANAPEAAREEIGDRTRFRFARTQPLPTYLVALAVGDLEIKEATRFTKPPIRLVTTKGKSATGDLALEATGGIVDALSEWFGIPYPYDKLDIVAVPEFRSGAMENAGLVTFREERLLLDPVRASVSARRHQALIIAHELAHQWFGDLVTASWWNDLWLNEGMATWMEARIVERWRPAYGARLDAVVSAHEVMDLDGLVSARAVRQPVVSVSDAQEAFDGITYDKGAALLTTIERWVGEDAFKRGVRDYLRANAFKSVQADRLLEALDRASGKDVTQMASSYLDKPGVPDVGARFECERGTRWHMELSSQPWRPLGSKLPEESDRAWTIPVCVRAQGDKKDTCTDLVAGAPSLVAGQGRCPTYVHPNWGSSYYRFSLSEKDFVRLAESRKELDPATRVSLLSNAWAAVRSGALEPKAMLRILPAFDDDDTRQVVDQVVSILDAMSETVIADEARPAFRKFALARLAKRKKALGWGPAPAEAKDGPAGAAKAPTPAKDKAAGAGKAPASSADDALVRGSVLRAMADTAEDDATLREAEEVAAKWLADPASVDADAGAVALDLASRRAGEPRLAALVAAVKGAKNREDRIVALRAMMGFDDPARLTQALDVTLGDEIRPNEMRYVFSAAFGRRTSRPIAEAWVRARWDELRKKLPGRLGSALVRAAGVGCSSTEAGERAAFYAPRVAGIEGAARSLDGALEAVSLCAALREKGAASMKKALLATKK